MIIYTYRVIGEVGLGSCDVDGGDHVDESVPEVKVLVLEYTEEKLEVVSVGIMDDDCERVLVVVLLVSDVYELI
jgi:hypothetical protein